MWKIFHFLAIGLFLVGCASTLDIKPHRPAFYEKEKMQINEALITTIGAFIGGAGFAGFGVFVGAASENYRREQKLLRAYPECQGLAEAELWKCTREIDIKEGRITSDYVDVQRADMDELNRIKDW